MYDEIKKFIKVHNFQNFKPNVGVIGENSVGKSTFLNTLVHTNEFKTGFGETTEIIKVLYIDKKPIFNKINCEYKSLDNYIEEYTLLNCLNLIDIPGYGKKYSDDTLQLIFKELDIIFLIVSAVTGVKKNDFKFLEIANKLNKKVILIYNQVDKVLENDLDEMNNTINIDYIYNLFEEKKLLKTLVCIIPYSGLKTFLSIYKNKEDKYKYASDQLYILVIFVALVSSFERYIVNYIPSKPIVKNKKELYSFIDKITYTLSNDLERKIKDEVSLFTSLNPFNSKNDEALRFVNDAENKILKEFKEYYIEEINKFNIEVAKCIEEIKNYQIFLTNYSLISCVNIPEIRDITINLDSLAWNSFLGDSFAEEVASTFKRKSKISLYEIVNEVVEMQMIYSEKEHNALTLLVSDIFQQLNEALRHNSTNIANNIMNCIIQDRKIIICNERKKIENIIKSTINQ